MNVDDVGDDSSVMLQEKEADDEGRERNYRLGFFSLCILGSYHLKYERILEGT